MIGYKYLVCAKNVSDRIIGVLVIQRLKTMARTLLRAAILFAFCVGATVSQGKGGCPRCTTEWDPVCGSNGKTYRNRCILYTENCWSGSNIKVVHRGVCVGDCPEACTMQFDPVCGTDGVTYGNYCLLRMERCRKNPKLEQLCKGECRKDKKGCRPPGTE